MEFDLTKGAQDGADVTPAEGSPNPNDLAPKEGDETPTEPTPSSTTTEVVVEGRPLEDAKEPESLETEVVDDNFHYPTHLDPMRSLVSTSGYLDDAMRYDAEKHRARVENREPDLKNPPPMQSTPLYTERELASTGLLRGQDPDVVLPVVRVVTEDERVARDEREARENPRNVEAEVY